MDPSLLIGLVLLVAPPPDWTVAAPDWQVEQADPERANLFKYYLDEQLRDRGFNILTPAEVESKLTVEQLAELQACKDEPPCLARMGEVLQVQGVLTGTLREFEDGSVLARLTLVSSDGSMISSTEAAGGNDDQMMAALDEAAIALETGLEVERPETPVATGPRWRQEISSAGVNFGSPAPPPALVPYQSSTPSLSIIELNEPENAWIPATAGGVFAAIGIGQVAISAQRSRVEAFNRQLGPAVDEPDYLTRAAAAVPRRQERAGWAGVGFGVAALAGAITVHAFGDSAPFTVEPFAGPSGGGMGLTTRW
jgi:hypothetical protein